MNGGIVLLDKPRGMTSFDCDKYVRRASGIKKVGHSGTLDPFATGLLPVFVGDALKFMRYTDDYDKTYFCKAFFGASSDTGDSDGVITPVKAPGSDDIGKIKDVLSKTSEMTEQIPPKYSAKKINGVKAYDLARKGVEFELKPNKIRIYSLDIGEIRIVDGGVTVEFTVHCSKGTYIRTICTDAGDMTGFGGYAMELRRLQVGPFEVDEAVKMDDEITYIDPIRTIGGMPVISLSKQAAEDIRNGKKIPASKIGIDPDMGIEEKKLCRSEYEGRLIAVIYVENGIVRVDRGFA
ncbi:MAG: tRNA pseudouridine(55) synthase TruB [Clostridiales bacterium]|nr:tRNA pseudouridine(55) synthase TruB [Clostridiales bacterium]